MSDTTKLSYADLEAENKRLRNALKAALPSLKLVSEAVISHDPRLCTPQDYRYEMARIALGEF